MTPTPTSTKEHIARPPKKRPLALFNYTLDSMQGSEDEPQDLSMKSRRVTTPTPVITTLTPPPPPAHVRIPSSPPPAPRPSVCTPLLPPRSTPDVSALLGLVGGSINLTTRNPNNNNNISCNTSASPSYSSNFSINTESNFSSNFAAANSSLMSSAGLRLISEVAAACGRPTVLRAPGGSGETHSSHASPYAPPTPRDPLRHAIRDRQSGVRPWHYHPYLPLGVYNLPSHLQSPRTATSARKDMRDVSSATVRSRAGSVSPPGETGSSSSESSPEIQQDGRTPRLSCPDCGRRYATMAGLAKHRQFHCLKDAGRSFGCKHCDKVYTSLGALKMHIRTHTLPCKCHLCGKAFSRPWLLQGHIRTHTGEKPFQCSQCDRCFADRSNLRAHLQTHTDVKKYACRTCPKTFSRMSLLVKHEDHGCPGVRPARPLALAPAPTVPL
ncbi:protein escargot-like [Penaeus chinensis]|uniref:protein escargot-like n=1 Tax=Penaeus chinensis TaxID=139456 RepID=UPI001FB82A67|nr:protein escargot-like [Penaeus chinensis]